VGAVKAIGPGLQVLQQRKVRFQVLRGTSLNKRYTSKVFNNAFEQFLVFSFKRRSRHLSLAQDPGVFQLTFKPAVVSHLPSFQDLSGVSRSAHLSLCSRYRTLNKIFRKK
jgi:hypothetical protein